MSFGDASSSLSVSPSFSAGRLPPPVTSALAGVGAFGAALHIGGSLLIVAGQTIVKVSHCIRETSGNPGRWLVRPVLVPRGVGGAGIGIGGGLAGSAESCEAVYPKWRRPDGAWRSHRVGYRLVAFVGWSLFAIGNALRFASMRFAAQTVLSGLGSLQFALIPPVSRLLLGVRSGASALFGVLLVLAGNVLILGCGPGERDFSLAQLRALWLDGDMRAFLAGTGLILAASHVAWRELKRPGRLTMRLLQSLDRTGWVGVGRRADRPTAGLGSAKAFGSAHGAAAFGRGPRRGASVEASLPERPGSALEASLSETAATFAFEIASNGNGNTSANNNNNNNSINGIEALRSGAVLPSSQPSSARAAPRRTTSLDAAARPSPLGAPLLTRAERPSALGYETGSKDAGSGASSSVSSSDDGAGAGVGGPGSGLAGPNAHGMPCGVAFPSLRDGLFEGASTGGAGVDVGEAIRGAAFAKPGGSPASARGLPDGFGGTAAAASAFSGVASVAALSSAALSPPTASSPRSLPGAGGAFSSTVASSRASPLSLPLSSLDRLRVPAPFAGTTTAAATPAATAAATAPLPSLSSFSFADDLRAFPSSPPRAAPLSPSACVSSPTAAPEADPAAVLVSAVLFSTVAASIGAWSVLFSKSLTFVVAAAPRSLADPYSWFVVVAFLATASFWVARSDQGLRLYPALLIMPLMQATWTAASVLQGGVYFEEFQGIPPARTGLLALGLVVALGGALAMGVDGYRGERDAAVRDDALSRRDDGGSAAATTPSATNATSASTPAARRAGPASTLEPYIRVIDLEEGWNAASAAPLQQRRRSNAPEGHLLPLQRTGLPAVQTAAAGTTAARAATLAGTTPGSARSAAAARAAKAGLALQSSAGGGGGGGTALELAPLLQADGTLAPEGSGGTRAAGAGLAAVRPLSGAPVRRGSNAHAAAHPSHFRTSSL